VPSDLGLCWIVEWCFGGAVGGGGGGRLFRAKQARLSSPLTGSPKLRNFLPGACWGSSPLSAVLSGMTHALRYLTPTRRGIPVYCQRKSSYNNMNKVEASTLHLQASNNFSSTQPFSNIMPSLWQLD
jgi:hypothetical protein